MCPPRFLVRFFVGPKAESVFLLEAVPSSTVPPLARYLIFLKAPFADPDSLSGVNVMYHHSLFGAGTADQKATFSAVVTTFGGCEVCETAQTFGSSFVWDPGDSEGGTGLKGTALQQARPAVFDVLDPGPLLLERRSRHKEGLARCADQPLVPDVLTILHVLQLDVLWNKNTNMHSNFQQFRYSVMSYYGFIG